jgi:hypothetical protein
MQAISLGTVNKEILLGPLATRCFWNRSITWAWKCDESPTYPRCSASFNELTSE